MDWLRRIDVIVLAFMLVYVVVTFCRVSWLPSFSRRTESDKLAAILKFNSRRLRSIAIVAPYLGCLGAFIGVASGLYGFPGGNMEKTRFLELLAGGIAKALLSTAAGILVAIPANCVYNYVCARVASIDCQQSKQERTAGPFQSAGRFPLNSRFSQLPTFGLTAALSLSLLVLVYTPYFDPPRTKGLDIEVASAQCVYDEDSRKLILHLTKAGKFFLNTEEEDVRSLPDRLSDIYRSRENRQLDLLADGDISFQAVADVIDLVENAGGTKGGAEPLNIRVRLITPATIQSGCVSIPLRSVPIRKARRSWR